MFQVQIASKTRQNNQNEDIQATPKRESSRNKSKSPEGPKFTNFLKRKPADNQESKARLSSGRKKKPEKDKSKNDIYIPATMKVPESQFNISNILTEISPKNQSQTKHLSEDKKQKS